MSWKTGMKYDLACTRATTCLHESADGEYSGAHLSSDCDLSHNTPVTGAISVLPSTGRLRRYSTMPLSNHLGSPNLCISYPARPLQLPVHPCARGTSSAALGAPLHDPRWPTWPCRGVHGDDGACCWRSPPESRSEDFWLFYQGPPGTCLCQKFPRSRVGRFGAC